LNRLNKFFGLRRKSAMLEVVNVSSVGNLDQIKSYIDARFAQNKYNEITQAIGMYSLFADSEHTISEQRTSYRQVLNLLKNRIKTKLGKGYAAWYTTFPKLANDAPKLAGTDKTASDAIASRLLAYGPFKSVDDFFFWALDDRRLTLDRIISMIEKTAAA
jgi:hypothetical protein